MKHTPGWKWTYYPESEHGCHCELHLADLEVGEGDSILYHGANWPMRKEHKNLIAAAPDMYEACKRALVYVQSDPAVYPLICSLQEAIAKAEGRF